MKTCDEIRRDNLSTLVREAGGAAKLAERYECTEAYIKQLAEAYPDSKTGRARTVGGDAARKLEACMNKPRGWMDNDHTRMLYPIQSATVVPLYQAEPNAAPYVQDLAGIAASMAPEGRAVLLYEARKIAEQFPLSKANQRE